MPGGVLGKKRPKKNAVVPPLENLQKKVEKLSWSYPPLENFQKKVKKLSGSYPPWKICKNRKNCRCHAQGGVYLKWSKKNFFLTKIFNGLDQNSLRNFTKSLEIFEMKIFDEILKYRFFAIFGLSYFFLI